MNTLPSWKDVNHKHASKLPMTVLEKFIYRNEPSGISYSAEWRANLLNIINSDSEHKYYLKDGDIAHHYSEGFAPTFTWNGSGFVLTTISGTLKHGGRRILWDNNIPYITVSEEDNTDG